MQEFLHLVAVIAIIVTVHELGHFLAARAMGIRVDVFSIGMGPRLLGYMRGRGWRLGPLPPGWLGQGATDYRLSLLPVGGYVRIAGMVEENPEESEQPPQPWEFRAKKPWQKAIVLSAGVVMNGLTAIILFTGLTMVQGGEEWHSTTVAYVAPESLGEKIGLRSGDRIVAVDGAPVRTWNQLLERLLSPSFPKDARLIELERPAGGERLQLRIPKTEMLRLLVSERSLDIAPAPSRVTLVAVDALRPAGRAGLQAGDTLLAFNEEVIQTTNQFVRRVQESRGRNFLLTWKRGGDTLRAHLQPDVDGKIGVQIATNYVGPREPVAYSLPEALGIGVSSSVRVVVGFFYAVGAILQGKLSVRESIGGPIQIARMATEQARVGLEAFLVFVAQLSVMLALINILPFPALDGGHLVIVGLEALLRRELPTRFKLAVQQIGVALLAMLLLFVLWNDLRR
ncbi:MAG: RIP metalloprotease RseP [Candidatus Kapabacteria bacterium]|nr:RIP metalloprotease RseP [Candidatus Kapabacteria bacterium]